VRATFAPYVLGGPGWYTHKVEPLGANAGTDSVTTRDFGCHAGFGAEVRLGRHELPSPRTTEPPNDRLRSILRVL
jgi:hypothetical protein